MESSKIGDTSFTIDFVCEKLTHSTGIKSKLLKWDIKQIGVGKGYLSTVYLITFEWENAGLPKAVVFKAPNTEGLDAIMSMDSPEMKKSMEDFLKIAHTNECVAYELLSTDSSVPVPKVYGTQLITDTQPGMIMMEHMEDGVQVDFLEGFNLQQLLSIADGLAKVHAVSVKYDDMETRFQMDINKQAMYQVIQSYDNEVKAIQPLLPKFYDDVVEPVINKFNTEQLMEFQYDTHVKLGLRPVLVHGDFHPNNMFFKKDPRDKGAGNEVLAFYDWQLAHPGNCMTDLAVTLAFSISGEMRRLQTTRVLQHYHDKLTQYTDGMPPFSLQDVSNAYKEAFRAQTVLVAALGASMWTKMPELGL